MMEQDAKKQNKEQNKEPKKCFVCGMILEEGLDMSLCYTIGCPHGGNGHHI